jgi:formylmethanofuran dehydrogenase subunit A
MEKFMIKNGLVFDPLNKIHGETIDLFIEGSKFVDKFSSENDVKEIDASGKTIIPAALDIHTHVACQQMNWIRLLGTKIKQFQDNWMALTLNSIAKEYISNGYTFILEANVYPSLTKHTIFEFIQLPVLDKAMLLNVSNLWPLELEFQRGKIDDMAIFLSDLLSRTKGYGFKIYNPFEGETWDFKALRKEVSSKGRLYNFSALDVYENLTKVNEHLGMPHSVHAHIEGYEFLKSKNNLFTILNKIEELQLEPNSKSSSKVKRSQIFHVCHGSAYNMDGNNAELINFLNNNQNIDADLGFLAFDDVNPLISSDRRLINSLKFDETKNHQFKIISSAVETEGDFYATFRTFDKNRKNDCILWANAFDLVFNVKNKWQLQFSLNFPNYGNISDVPKIATWLMSNDARKKFMGGMNKEFLNDSLLKNSEDTLSFNDFVIITRASPAKSLGLGDIKGNLGIGADADLNILNINVNELDIIKDYQKLENSLTDIEYVLKEGKVIKKNNNIDLNSTGKIFWAEGKPEKEDKSFIMNSKKDFYQKFGSVFYDSLNIPIETEFTRKIE